LLFAACNVGPDYHRPKIEVSNTWVEPAHAGPVDAKWWGSFDDPVLTKLVEQALANNPSLAEASARLAEARALREAAQGGRLPQGGASASANENRVSENGQFPVANIPGFDPDFSLFDAGFDASWEIDLWGGTSRAIQSAVAREQAAMWARRDAEVSLVAEVARAYIDFRAAQASLDIAQDRANASAEIARLTQLLYAAGEADQQSADLAASAAQGAGAALDKAQADVAGAEYRIGVLAGTIPEKIRPELDASSAPVPAPPEVIAGGIRSELLKRRPDVRRAERELAAATANIGVATAQLYPSFSLVGGVGLQAKATDKLTDSGSLRYSVGPTFRWPIFSLGRLRAQVRAADARAQAAAASYEKAVLGALADSESAANRYAASTRAAGAAGSALAREQNAYKLAELREQRGEDSKLALAQARLQLTQAKERDLLARAARSDSAVALYKSLGGGWSN
jgi:NodT family efflux transporter outer membrane factor (OMF) lipoprotein